MERRAPSATCEKSWHTPWPSSHTSRAVLFIPVDPRSYANRSEISPHTSRPASRGGASAYSAARASSSSGARVRWLTTRNSVMASITPRSRKAGQPRSSGATRRSASQARSSPRVSTIPCACTVSSAGGSCSVAGAGRHDLADGRLGLAEHRQHPVAGGAARLRRPRRLSAHLPRAGHELPALVADHDASPGSSGPRYSSLARSCPSARRPPRTAGRRARCCWSPGAGCPTRRPARA